MAAFIAIEAVPGTRAYARQLMVPFFKAPVVADLTVPGAAVFMFLVLVGTTNAVNLTDGLDGLAAGCMGTVSAAYLALAYVAGNVIMASYLQVPSVSGAHELAVFCGCLMGAVLGFLWWNAYPAKVFMGDTGALALGAALSVMAVVSKLQLLLVITGLMFVLSAVSVVLQVGSYKLRRKRIFKMAPLHHHFELKGIPETKIVSFYYLITIVLCLIGILAVN